MTDVIAAALVSGISGLLGAVIGGSITYMLQKRQMNNEALIRKQQIEKESELRYRSWVLAEYAGRTAAAKKVVESVETLYRLQQSPIRNGSLAVAQSNLLNSLEPDFWLIEEIDTRLIEPRDALVKQIYGIAAQNNLEGHEATDMLKSAHDIALSFLRLIDEFKKENARTK